MHIRVCSENGILQTSKSLSSVISYLGQNGQVERQRKRKRFEWSPNPRFLPVSSPYRQHPSLLYFECSFVWKLTPYLSTCSDMAVLSVTKRPFLKTQPHACASWWTSSMTVICTRRLSNTKKQAARLKRRPFGKSTLKWSRHSMHSTYATYCTETWRLLMFSCKRMERQN